MRNKRLIALLIILGSVTLLAILSSVIFSVQSVTAYCYNATDKELDAQLEQFGLNGIRRGSSVFLLNDGKVTAHIESQPEFAAVEVVNIERKFPNRVFINYAKVLPYMVYRHDGGEVYVSSALKNVGAAAVGESVPEAYAGLIELRSAAQASSLAIGDRLFEPGSDAYYSLSHIMAALTRIGYRERYLSLIEFIDVEKTHTHGITYIKMHTGVYLKLLGNDDRTLARLRAAVSLYESDDKYRGRGMIIAGPSAEALSYNENADYK